MNISSLSLEKCRSLNPQTVLDYLQHSQWQKTKTVPNRSSTWEIQHPTEGKLQILLPLDSKIPDFPDRMHDLIQIVAFVEQRSESEVFNDFANVIQIAQELGREVLNVHLYFDKKTSTLEAPAKKLASILASLQDTLDAVGQSEGGRARPLGKIAQEIIDRTSLDIISIFKGSFGVRLATALPNPQLNLIDAPLAEVAIESLIAIINSGSDKDKLSELMQKHQQRTASRYRRFLISLTNSEADLRIEWGSPNLGKSGNASLSVFDAWRAIEICSELVVNEPEEYEVVGTLCSVDRKRKTFRLDDIYDKKSYFGKIDDEVFKSGVEMTAVPPKNYRATIQGTIQENPTTGETSIEYKLIALAPWNKTRPEQKENSEEISDASDQSTNDSKKSSSVRKATSTTTGKSTRKPRDKSTSRVS